MKLFLRLLTASDDVRIFCLLVFSDFILTVV